jgi:tetrahydromethanopterin S-methyltransferase subunit F
VDTSNTTEQIGRDRRRLLGTAATGIVATGTAIAIVLAVAHESAFVNVDGRFH